MPREGRAREGRAREGRGHTNLTISRAGSPRAATTLQREGRSLETSQPVPRQIRWREGRA